MIRKKALSFLVIFSLLSAFFPNVVPLARASNSELWALIICGSSGGSFSTDPQYMYHTLDVHYDFDGIRYLDFYDSRPGVYGTSTLDNVRSAIRDWLFGNSDDDDIIFIYFSSHGGGYNSIFGWESGRVETPGDEGNEVYELNYMILSLNCYNPYGTSPVELGPWRLTPSLTMRARTSTPYRE